MMKNKYSLESKKHPYYIFLFSAKSNEGLYQKLLDMEEWISEEEANLGNMSYTLTIGRSHFSERVAIVASDIEELKLEIKIKYNDLKNKDKNKSNKKHNESKDNVFIKLADSLASSDLSNSQYKTTLKKVANLYIEGNDFEWGVLYNDQLYYKIPMPTYPFKKDKYWLKLDADIKNDTKVVANKLCKVLDSNISTMNEQIFEKELKGEEFFLNDHIVSNDKILPGVVQLEMALAAVELSNTCMKVKQIRDVIWGNTIKLDNNEDSKTVQVRLYTGEIDNEFEFEITSGLLEGIIIHSQGTISCTRKVIETKQEKLDIDSLCKGKTRINGREVYNNFRSHNLNLGASFQSITEIFVGKEEAVAFIELPIHLKKEFKEFSLHPTIIDGVLEAVIGLVSSNSDVEGSVALPFTFDNMEIYGAIPENCISYVKKVELSDRNKDDNLFNVTLADEAGNVLLKFTNFLLKVFYKGRKQNIEDMRFTYQWKESLVDINSYNKVKSDIIIFNDNMSLYNEIKKQYDGNVFIVESGNSFRKVKEDKYIIDLTNKEDYFKLFNELKRNGHSLDLILYSNNYRSESAKPNYVENYSCNLFIAQALIGINNKYARVINVCPGDKNSILPEFGAIRGFNKTVKLENSKLNFTTLFVDDGSSKYFYNIIATEIEATDDEVLYSEGRRFVNSIEEIKNEVNEKNNEVLKAKGVYCITGGLGKLGLISARYLAERFNAKLVIFGRSPLSNEKKREIDSLIQLGAEVIYVIADVCKEEDVVAAINKAKETFGHINGIIHCAGVTNDSYIVNKNEKHIGDVINTKTNGLVNLDIATQNEKLDFIVAFSSIASIIGNFGQSEYAFANAFMDYYVKYRNKLVNSGERYGKSISINWTLWKDGGMLVDDKTMMFFKNTIGLKPLETKDGLEYFHSIVNSNIDQLLVLQGDRKKITDILGLNNKCSDKKSAKSNENVNLIENVQDSLSNIISSIMKIDLKDLHMDEDMGEYGFNSITFTDFTNVINEKYSIRVTPAIFFEYPTIRSFAGYLIEEYKEKLLDYFNQGKVKEKEMVIDYDFMDSAILKIRRNRENSKKFKGNVKIKQDSNEPIAIVGISGVMPKSKNLQEFWSNLEEQKDLISEVPEDRWDFNELNRLKSNNSDKLISKWGGFIEDVDKFDRVFFNINPREADLMDPQQRIFLQTVWSTIEDAGYKTSDLSESKTGLFVGVATNDYSNLLQDNDIEIEAYSSTGISHCVLANRISYLFNFHGPSEPIDTACSSSLVAIHRGVESIRNGDCDQAIVGGVNVIVSPILHISFSRAGMLSPDGRCKTFDKSANGYVRGEGAGAIMLKPLSKAEADGDYIYAVIKGTAINHGGKVSSLTAPNPKAEAEVLVEAYNKAGIKADTIGYIEAHGTGTNLGDPVEINALKNAFKEMYTKDNTDMDQHNYCGVGTVKTNIGHLEAAAGIAGVLKVVLSMKHKRIPGVVNFKELNPYIEIDKSPFYIVEKTKEWETIKGEKRRAGVSSFGFGGVNAHVVLEEYDNKFKNNKEVQLGNVVVLSAKNKEQLLVKAKELSTYIRANSEKEEMTLDNIAYTLQNGREEMEERIAFVVKNVEDILNNLESYIENQTGKESILTSRVTLYKKTGKKKNIIDNSDEEISFDGLTNTLKDWINGGEVSWSTLYTNRKGRKIPLPSYPFRKEVCWVRKNNRKIAPKLSASKEKVVLHPMVDSNESTMEEEKFKKVLRIEEMYLRDHVVGGKVLLPGVAYLEMVRAAAVLAGIKSVTGIKDVRWIKSIEMDSDKKEIFISFEMVGNEIGYSVYSLYEDRHIIHCKGKILQEILPAGGKVDIEEVKARCITELDKDKCYNTIFKKVGFDYGPAFRVTERAYCSENEGLSKLVLPEYLLDDYDKYVLHPSIIDGAVRSLSWVGKRTDEDLTLRVPVAMDRIEILGKVPTEVYARACEGFIGTDSTGTKKYNIQIVDCEGNEVVRIYGFSIKQYISSNIVKKDNAKLVFYKPAWIEERVITANTNIKAVIIFGLDKLTASIKAILRNKNINENKIIQVLTGERYQEIDQYKYVINPNREDDYNKLFTTLLNKNIDVENIVHGWNLENESIDLRDNCEVLESFDVQLDKGLYSILNLFKSVTKLKISSKVTCLYAYKIEEGISTPLNEMIAGFSKSHASENHLFQLSSIKFNEDNYDKIAESIVNELVNKNLANGTEITYEGEKRLRRKLISHNIVNKDGEDKFITGGVYLITGGNGALGMTVATFLAQKYKTKLVITGRAEPCDDIKGKIGKLIDLGAEAIYVKGDISIKNDVINIIQKGKDRFNNINGIIHCAGIGDETKVIDGNKESFNKIMLSKVQGTVNLDIASKDEKLDVLVLFSSTSVEIGDIGVCSYASANTFMDRYVSYREKLRKENKRYGKTVSINWPLWKDGRYKVEEAQQKILYDYYGMSLLESENGVKALNFIMKENVGQVLVGYGNEDKINKTLGIKVETQVSNITKDSNVDNKVLLDKTIGYLVKLFAKTMAISKDKIEHAVPFDVFGIDSIMIMELNDSLSKDFNEVSKTLFYEFNTIDSLADYFIENYRERLIELLKIDEIKENKVIAIENNDIETEFNQLRSEDIFAKNRFMAKQDNSVYIKERYVDRKNMDIAVIGLDGRFPMSKNISELWENLKSGKDCITEIPKDRWDYTKDYDDEKGKKGKIYTKYGGFIDDVDKFDPLFFQMTPRDAQLTDPQERLFLECAYHTLEDAGYTSEEMSKNKVGVYVGVMYGHYQLIGTEGYAKGNLVAPNSSFASIANRVSYLFNFQGPSIALDTMCSSSLTAIHLACESIRNGESDAALAGGVNVTIHRNKYIFLCSQRFASSEGKCRAFGEGGDGYVASEGVGAVLLKSLNKAIEDGDHIYGVIKGTTINSGGKTSGYTVPNPNAQTSVIDEAIQKSNIDPRSITYIEAHGTGTSLGDPIEITGLSKAFGKYTKDKQFCSIGSVKSNIGHLESAAGIASVAKVLLQIKNKMLVPSIHSDNLNPNINFKDTPFHVQRTLEKWENNIGDFDSSLRISGVSSFGAGGANAHVIIEEFTPKDVIREMDGKKLIVISAKNKERLMEKVVDLNDFLKRSLSEEYNLTNISYTLQLGREEMEERIAIVASTIDELLETLDSIINKERLIENVFSGNTAVALENGGKLFGEEREDIEFIVALIRKNSMNRVAKLWILGNKIDWNKIYTNIKPNRVSLPLYPFARERYWLENMETEEAGSFNLSTGNSNKKVIHPLIDVNISTLKEQRYRKNLSVEEFFLRDHIVSKQILLPGVAYIEMARAAGEIAGEATVRVIKDVTWLKPVIMTEDTKDLDIIVKPVEDAVEYEIFSSENDKKVIHSKGKIQYSNEDISTFKNRHFDVDTIKSRCTDRKNKDYCYDHVFKNIGFDYGPSFQVTREVLSGEKETLAMLSLTQAYRYTLKGFVLHPSLFDGAIRSVAVGNYDESDNVTYIPFSLGYMEIYDVIPADCYVYTKVKEQPNENNHGLNIFDISIMDLKGKEVVRIEDFVVRPFTKKPSENKEQEIFYYSPELERREANLNEVNGEKNILIFGDEGTRTIELTNYLENHSDKYDNYIVVKKGTEYKSLKGSKIVINPSEEEGYIKLINELRLIGFEVTHILHMWSTLSELVYFNDYNEDNIKDYMEKTMDSGIYSVVNIFKEYSKVNGLKTVKLLFAFKREDGYFTAPNEVVTSFAKSIITLNHRFEVVVAAFDRATLNANTFNKVVISELLSKGNTNETEVRYVDNQRYARKIKYLNKDEVKAKVNPIKFKENGVYFISGGTGALGMIFAQHIAKKYKAKVILTGRKAINEHIVEAIEKLNSLGGEGIYLQGDVSNTDEVRYIMNYIKHNFGNLDGIFHCAGQGDTVPITESNKERVENILEAKVRGVINLDYLSEDFNLDFMILFSSISVEIGDLGVGSYSIANSFMDRFSKMRNEMVEKGHRRGATISIDWSLWSDGGFDIPESEAEFYFDYLGMKAMNETLGIRALEEICSMDLSGVIVASGDKDKIDKALKVDKNNVDNALEMDKKDMIIDLLTKLQNGDISGTDVEQFMGGIL
ncbi:SDR family NAD(P)-dependent oxidoreductase [Clostridium estertheticum]|uniref:SDR family NAD(P)-dependent oxidoreductase n=1 Tax=Clostridium estertheticum TaxID=238834 RepID=UPI0013EE7102|nr:SDR family NAD(P)-dependent oxidoreductase [Clostridium estertheticum]MBZ9609086.1 SDR family NAD(P)-dependent oxidoreductase [Clostridium estertheticum]